MSDARTLTDTPSATPALANLRLGTAPDSWGVWFPEDPRQVPWPQFLDEAARPATPPSSRPLRLPADQP
ncbi:hypothetical protein [Pseudonocardia sp.]|jgi:inosose dehydratase|uniref:hypothetical protein n=1 Tax=Pseudonocardia sp. TaxID=60912 RepID=UPI0026357F9F|nr:hypothetical protein [Pseudonocardia sp.]MCW2721396.1 iolE [Pseudonocardia sp.]